MYIFYSRSHGLSVAREAYAAHHEMRHSSEERTKLTNLGQVRGVHRHHGRDCQHQEERLRHGPHRVREELGKAM